jgi:hypothetical protein
MDIGHLVASQGVDRVAVRNGAGVATQFSLTEDFAAPARSHVGQAYRVNRTIHAAQFNSPATAGKHADGSNAGAILCPRRTV